jgi:hypothetical protein
MRTDSAAQQTRFAAILMFKDVAAAHHWLDTANEALTALTPAASAQTHEGYLQVLGILNPSGQAA